MKIQIKLSIIILIIFKLLLSDSIAKEFEVEVFKHIDSKNWQKAEELTTNLAYKALNKIVLSQKFLDSNYKNNKFGDAIRFLYNNPNWPQFNKLKESAELYLNYNTDQKLILDWFSKNKPSTGLGYKFYALASAKLLKDNPKLTNIIREGWIYGDFNEKEEKQYYADNKKYLRVDDNIKKIDEYLWKGDVSKAKKSLHLVQDGYKKAFLAEIAAIENDDSKEILFSKVNKKFYVSGLLFQYLKSKKKEIPDDRTIALFNKVKPDKHHNNDWEKLRLYYAREFIHQKDFKRSYKIASSHFQINNESICEAEWFSGWLALRFINRLDLAKMHFQKFLTLVHKPISIARGKYWLARTMDVMGNKADSIRLYKEASKYSYTFYGQAACLELKENKIILPKTHKTKQTNYAKNQDILDSIKLLMKYGKEGLAQIYAKDAINGSSNKAYILAVLDTVKNNTHHSLETSRSATHKHIFVKDSAFPAPYNVKNSPVEMALVYSIIRQESGFNQHAIDDLGARGLMQIMEETAKTIAKSMSTKCILEQLNKDPYYNIKFGSKYLKDLSSEHDNSYILAIASYNAGSHRIKKWIELFGDPRKMKNVKEVIDWMELIPFHVTRNYVQRVMENIQVYRTILNKNNSLKLRKDLMGL